MYTVYDKAPVFLRPLFQCLYEVVWPQKPQTDLFAFLKRETKASYRSTQNSLRSELLFYLTQRLIWFTMYNQKKYVKYYTN